MKKSKLFLICCITFVIGITIASFISVKYIQNDLLWFVLVISLIVVLILFWKKSKMRLIALIGLFLFLAIWRYSIDLPQNTSDKIWHYNNQIITAIGVINNEPDIRAQNQKLEFNAQEIILENKIPVTGKVLITAKLYPTYNYGDEVKIICELQAPKMFNGFAYDRYLARYDIFSVCYFPKIEFLNSDGNKIYNYIFKTKNKLREIIDYGLIEPEASLARAIILGDKKSIPPDLRDKFSQAGISHIVAISGMHISILSAIVMAMLLGLGLSRNNAFYAATIFLLTYIALIGLPASAMRAGIMGFLVLWALKIGRLNKITNSLVLSAVILLLINPRLLRDDIGFQLSFLAVLGIIFFCPIFEKFFQKIVEKLFKERELAGVSAPVISLISKIDATPLASGGEEFTNKLCHPEHSVSEVEGSLRYQLSDSSISLRSSRNDKKINLFLKILNPIFSIFNVTMAAQIFLLPIIALNFSQVSIIAPISNLLILWVLPILMFAILTAIILSLFFPYFSPLFFAPSLFLLKYIIITTELLVKALYSYVTIHYIWFGWIALYYLVVIWFLVWYKKNEKQKNT